MVILRKYIRKYRWWFICLHTCSKKQCKLSAVGSSKIDYHRKRYWCRDHFIDEIERLDTELNNTPDGT